MTTRKIVNKEEQLLFKLESIIDLYKNFQDGAEEYDKLKMLDALGNIRQILTKCDIAKPLRRREVSEIEAVVKGLNSHVKAMALDDLFDEVKGLKCRMDAVEKRWELEKTLQHPKIYLYDEDDDEIWSRISAKRKEILGKSSLWLWSRPPRNIYKVRFNLGSPVPVRAGTAGENEMENADYSTDQLLRNRITNLKGFLEERKTRLRTARRCSKNSSGLSASADFTVQNSRKSLQKARNARHGIITHKSEGINDTVRKMETHQDESGTRCEECYKLMKERDKFWGLESDSEEEEIKNFKEHVRRRSLRRDSRTIFEKRIGKSSSSPRYKEAASRYRPGRGTWATPAYVPPWEVNDVDRRKVNSMQSVATVLDLEEARFGQKKGILKKFLSRLIGHHMSS